MSKSLCRFFTIQCLTKIAFRLDSHRVFSVMAGQGAEGWDEKEPGRQWGHQSGGRHSGNHVNRGRRNYHRGRNREDERDKKVNRWGPSEGDDSYRSRGSARGHGGRGRGGRPPGLKGKDIGMYYAQLSKQKTEQRIKDQRAAVTLQGDQKRVITSLLHDIQASRECPPQPDRYTEERDDGRNSRLSPAEEENYDGLQGSASCDVGHGRGNRPPGLSGKQIGMYYVGESKEKAERRMADQSNRYSEESEDDDSLEEYEEEVESEGPSSGSATNVSHEDPTVTEVLQMQMGEDLLVSDNSDIAGFQTATTSWDNARISADFAAKQTTTLYQDMQEFRNKLPAYTDREAIVDLISSNKVVVLSGETGCGKTTQVPQFILDEFISQNRGAECHIICTQPRRISAISVAERVAAERGEKCGESVGYMIRLEHKLPRDAGSILFCTTGILLKMLEGDKSLSRATHIILDEIHERDLLSDFLIIVLKDILTSRPDLKLVLMSATLNAEAFSKYFDNCPMINIPGYTFPVEEFLLEDVIEMLHYEAPYTMQARQPRRRDLIAQREMEEREVWLRNLEGGVNTDKRYSRHTINQLQSLDFNKVDTELIYQLIWHISLHKKEGAILVFVPGWGDINDVYKKLMANMAFKSASHFRIFPLHSLMPTINQREVFERPPPGVRKIVIATNIAETSITIDDVVYVIDGGRIKVKGFSPDTNMASLDSQLVSKANARQRRGRAGRVQPGECYHLYSGYQASIMDNYLAPEILRTRLEELCLTIKLLNLGKIVPFVQKAMQPPSLAAVESAIVNLQDLNALDKEENLLPLGKHLARMPLDPHTGKMILYGAMFKCLDPILTIAASLNFKDPFFAPLEKKAEADQARMKLAENCLSDHITLVKAYNKWERCRKRGTHRQFCYDNFLSDSTLVMLRKMRDQLAEVLHELGFLRERHINQSEANVNSGNESLVKAIVCAGLYPNIGMIGKLPKNKWSQIQFQLRSGRCKLFPGSVAREIRDPRACWVVYHKIMKTSDVWMYDCSVVTPYSLLFFGGDIKKMNAST
ncbi:ATP-dependent DNA/RNA helicase DHX36-like [Dreissena polymorpha]|uniref:ATP-dependent DNA/RNA helicase DHX36-like n=1 Tax=Dreissena polymorpha TaxID=45954 RepID=UPI002264331B|nr:ATP-dependent DNA/RNA helicase DHX36-like [Dreissena polymorpha]